MNAGDHRSKTLSDKLRDVLEHKNLKEYIQDENYLVRYAVCETGFGLDILLHDPEPAVRRQVAMQQYGLETLMYDRDEWVRAAVAQQGYGLNILLKDESIQVRNIAARMIEKQEHKAGLEETISRAEKRDARISGSYPGNSCKRGRTAYGETKR